MEVTLFDVGLAQRFYTGTDIVYVAVHNLQRCLVNMANGHTSLDIEWNSMLSPGQHQSRLIMAVGALKSFGFRYRMPSLIDVLG